MVVLLVVVCVWWWWCVGEGGLTSLYHSPVPGAPALSSCPLIRQVEAELEAAREEAARQRTQRGSERGALEAAAFTLPNPGGGANLLEVGGVGGWGVHGEAKGGAIIANVHH